MKTRGLAVLVVAVIAAAGFWFFKRSAEQPVNTAAIPSGQAPAADQKIIGGGTVTMSGQSPTVNMPPPDSPPSDPDFQKFLENEAKQVDAAHVDSARKTAELKEVVAKLTPNQARQLLQTAKNPASSAGERILSAYLMVEAGPRAESELRQLIISPLNYPGAHPAHSEMETRSMQERSVRMMALEGLISRAEREPSARETLGKTIPDIPDPYIKSYAEKRLQEIKAH